MELGFLLVGLILDGGSATSPSPSTMASAWTELGLSPWLANTCIEMGLKRPTPIQTDCIGPVLRGQDVLGSAATGSGKTAAFALPIIQALSEDPYGVFAVVLSPARELASQIADQFTALGVRMPVRVSVVVGGVDMMRQALELAQRPHIVIGTPGRLVDHLRSSGTAVTMLKSRFLVIDEADRLLELGFADDLRAVLEHMPARRQTLLFSATMSGALKKLQGLALTAPHVADLAASERVPSTCTLEYVFIPSNVRDLYLVFLLRSLREAKQSAIVFTSTCRACEVLACTLRALGVDCAPLHSQQSQAHRLAAIGRFKQGSLSTLVATDVAARGIDIPQVGAVINHNVPAMPRDFIHRCGRTARAGRTGRTVTLVSQYDVEVLMAIEEHIGRKLETLELAEDEVLGSLHEVASARRVAILELTENGFLEKEKARMAKRKRERLGDDGDESGHESLPEDLEEWPGEAAGEAAGEVAGEAADEAAVGERGGEGGRREKGERSKPSRPGGKAKESDSHSERGRKSDARERSRATGGKSPRDGKRKQARGHEPY